MTRQLEHYGRLPSTTTFLGSDAAVFEGMITAMSFEPFSLWCAVQHEPELTGRAVVTVADERVMQASPAAREAGIRRGMPLTTARLHTEALDVVPENAPNLQAEWEILLEALYSVSPWVEPLRLGLMLLRVSEAEAKLLAEQYRARVGMSRFREVAVLAAFATREGEARIVEEDTETAFLKQLPTYFLKGVGLPSDAVTQLHFLGIEHAGDLLAWRVPQLKAFLGKEAEDIIPFLYGPWGEDMRPYQPPQTLEAQYDFDDATCEPAALYPILTHLAERLSARLEGRTAGRLTVRANAQGLEFTASRLAKQPLNSRDTVYRLALLALQDTGAQPLGITALCLRLSGLVRPNHQGSLWRTAENRQKAIEAVTEKFPDALVRFRTVNPYVHAREQQFAVVRLRDGHVITKEVTHAPDSARNHRQPQCRRSASSHLVPLETP